MNGATKRPVFCAAVFFCGMVGASSPSWAQNKAPLTDAQVEANVLRALASAPELSTQNIQSTSVYGTVTLSGNVHDETLRTRAENLVARTDGVKKVVDEMALGDTPAAAPAVAQARVGSAPDAAPVLQSDGSYAPTASGAPTGSAPPDQGYIGQGSAQGSARGTVQGSSPAPPYNAQSNDPQNGGQPPSMQPPAYGGQSGDQESYPQGSGEASQRPYGPPAQNGYGPPPQNAYGPPAQNGYGPPPQNGYSRYDNGSQGGQAAGIAVTVPSGSTLQVRIDRGIDSNHIQPGTSFTGTVLNDVVAGGTVALPRGTQVQGTVVDAKSAGVLKGEGELALQLTNLTLGGQNLPVTTAVWQREGRSKSLSTVNTALGLGALGAVFGGLAGGGAGAAIGAGVGGAVGVGTSAASPGGRVIVPPESVLSFSLAQPLAVKTVSQNEMQRMAYAAGQGSFPRPVVVRRPYYGPYPYGRYAYGPYGYPSGAYFYGR